MLFLVLTNGKGDDLKNNRLVPLDCPSPDGNGILWLRGSERQI
jgi:hypothetical protein